MNKLEISFAEPAGVSTIGQQAWGLIQDAERETVIKGTRNRSKVTYEELELIESLRKGEETAFATLIESYHGRLLRLAQTFVSNQAVAEEVVQETWMGVLEGIGRFEGRSSLKTWIFRILTNRAKTRGIREKRYVSLTGFGTLDDGDQAVEIGPEHLFNSDQTVVHSAGPLLSPEEMTPEKRLLSKECVEQIEGAIRTLPPIQQRVITLRDVEGMEATEICDLLDISKGNQRVLLHRGRSKVRLVVESYLKEENEKFTISHEYGVASGHA